MNIIDKYTDANRRLNQFDAWASMIGMRYEGGGGGTGDVVNANGSLEIYFQEYNGSQNYHDLDKEFKGELSEAMKKYSRELISSIRHDLERQLSEAKSAAEVLAKEILS